MLYVLGVPEKVIQDILRHANVSMTSTYYIKTVPAQGKRTGCTVLTEATLGV